MICWKTGIFLSLIVLIGCQAVSDLGDSTSTFNWAQLATGASGDSAFDVPNVNDGSVRVQLVNASGQVVDARITMRVVGQVVHLATRQIPVAAEDVFIGPDRADSVLVEVTLLTNPPVIRTPLSYFLGRDFVSGDTIRIVIDPEPTPPPADANEQGPVPPTNPITVAIVGLDTDIRVLPGMAATFAVRVGGDTTSSTRVDVFADRDVVPANGNEIPITLNLPAAAEIPIQWTVPELPAGRYPVYAEVRDSNSMVRSAATAGVVLVDALPQLTFDSPRPEQAVTRGRTFIAAWAGEDADDNAIITIFLDTNTTHEGTEPVLRSGISAADVQDRQLAVETANLATGTYYVGGLIDDGLATVVAYAGPVCIVDRLVGRFSPAEFSAGEITTITGGTDNRLLGTAVDISRTLSGSDSAMRTVLLSDPAAVQFPTSAPASMTTGEVDLYQHAPTAPWPRDLTIDDMTLRMLGEQDLAQPGQAIALLAPLGAENADSEILIGAPAYRDPCVPTNGRAYFLQGREVLAFDPNQRTFDLSTLNDSPVGTQFRGEPASAAGLGVAALGDIDGSGHPDFAIGATRPAQGTSPGGLGSVYLFSGNRQPFGGPLSQAFDFRLDGVQNGDLTGYAITGVADVNGDSFAELAIGAPLAGPVGASVPTGRIYLVFGEEGLLAESGGTQSLSLLGIDGLDGRILAGENAGDQAGAALAAADFDGDGRPDLLIGAPGYGAGRGRAYLIYDLGNAALPAPPQVVELGLVGTTYPGVIFDGLAVGDQLGFAVANGGDFDADGVRDILLGAPGVESQRGAAYLIYGQRPQRLQGLISLTTIATCSLPGLELVGVAGQVSRLGTALSSGDLHGDGGTDLAIGAPGDLSNPGQVHLLFGRGLPLVPLLYAWRF